MKFTLIRRLIIAIVAFFAIIISCRKIDSSVDPDKSIDYSAKFFNLPENTDPVVKLIA